MKYETQMRLAENLKRLRASKALSQAEMARQLQIDRSVYALFEAGRRCPDPEMLYQISRIFGIPMEALLETDPERIVSEVANAAFFTEGEEEVLRLFRKLSPFSRGRLLERAEDLASWDSICDRFHKEEQDNKKT